MKTRFGWTSILWLCVVMNGIAAESWSISFSSYEPVVRTGMVWRATVTGSIPETQFDAGPYQMQISLNQAGTVIASEDIYLTKLGQLVLGVQLVLPINSSQRPDQPITALVTVTNRQQRDTQVAQQILATPISIQRSLESHLKTALERHAVLDPLPALWFEQAGELMLGQANLQTCEALRSLDQQITQWLTHGILDSTLQALRDPIDGSLQPWRLHMPIADTVHAVVLTLRTGESTLRKSAWPTLPPAWINAARSNHIAMIEVYAAGDRDWSGIALTRARLVLAHALKMHPSLQGVPLIAFGVGRGAQGAIALIEQTPEQFSALALHNPVIMQNESPSLSPQSEWQRLQHSGTRPAHIVGTPIISSAIEDPGARSWLARMRLTQTPITDDVGSPQQANFWQRCAESKSVTPPSEWIVLTPGRYGRVIVDEMNEWGITGTLHWRTPNELITTGIKQVRVIDGAKVVVNGSLYREITNPNTSKSLPRKVFGQAGGPAKSYAERAFTLVIGTGESAAALSSNRALANAFTAAWVAHAHGRPRTIDDSQFKEEEQLGRHLVLVGNTRSNSVLAKLLTNTTTFPATWTTRTLTIEDKNWLRSEHRPIAITWPHPANDGRVLLVLDGSPRWLQPGLPLTMVPDLALGHMTTENEPEIWRNFSNDWR
jgi:hypothetical protein